MAALWQGRVHFYCPSAPSEAFKGHFGFRLGMVHPRGQNMAVIVVSVPNLTRVLARLAKALKRL